MAQSQDGAKNWMALNNRGCSVSKLSVFGSVRFLNFGFGSVTVFENLQFSVSVRFGF